MARSAPGGIQTKEGKNRLKCIHCHTYVTKGEKYVWVETDYNIQPGELFGEYLPAHDYCEKEFQHIMSGGVTS